MCLLHWEWLRFDPEEIRFDPEEVLLFDPDGWDFFRVFFVFDDFFCIFVLSDLLFFSEICFFMVIQKVLV